VTEVINMPIKRAAQKTETQEIVKIRQEMSNTETYADLTPFGLGMYKLRNKGDRHLWDVTKPSDEVTYSVFGEPMMYDVYLFNRRPEYRGNLTQRSVDEDELMYYVAFYEGTYIILEPVWSWNESKYYLGYLYLCKELGTDTDLYGLRVTNRDREAIEKLLELPGEWFTKTELTELLGYIFIIS